MEGSFQLRWKEVLLLHVLVTLDTMLLLAAPDAPSNAAEQCVLTKSLLVNPESGPLACYV